MIDSAIKKQILDEILKSKSFANSKLNKKLLTYLVQCSIENKSPSEYSIAIDVFEKDSSFNTNEDTIVRVSVYNLRKKLERYYNNMGKKNKVRVKIPKGHYEVEFFNHSKENIIYNFKNPVPWLVAALAVVTVLAFYLYMKIPTDETEYRSTKKLDMTSEIFSDLVKSPNQKIITLGNDFIYFSDFSEFNTTSIRKMIRNSEINTEGDFEKFKSSDNSRENLKKLPFSLFNQASVWALPYVSKIFNILGIEYLLKSGSNLTSSELKSNDIFFIGSFWTLGILEQVLKNIGISYTIIGKETLTIPSASNPDSLTSYDRVGVPAFDHDDYSVFIKIPGPNNNNVFLVISFYATGSVGTMQFLSHEKTLNELKENFTQKFNNIPPYYMVLFKSTGYNREVLSTELISIQKLEPSDIIW